MYGLLGGRTITDFKKQEDNYIPFHLLSVYFSLENHLNIRIAFKHLCFYPQ
jgi:hypothetical protein